MKRILFAAASTAILVNAITGIGGSPPGTESPGVTTVSAASAVSNELAGTASPVIPAVLPAATKFEWPSGKQVPVLRKFQVEKYDWQPGHRGVDLALAAGDSVYAAGAGKVIYSGQLNDRELISIEHSGGIRTTYEPVTPTVRRGDIVQLGQKIGVVTAAHCTPFSCLHWGAKLGAKSYINPLSLLADQQIRLLE